MDRKFSNNLQRELELLGRDKPFAPPKSQDPLDRLLHEYFVSGMMAKIGGDRYKLAKEAIFEQKEDELNSMCADAVKYRQTQNSVLVTTEHYTGSLRVSKPIEGVDVKQFTIELLKAGVDKSVIDKAMAASVRSNAPARTLAVLTTHERGS